MAPVLPRRRAQAPGASGAIAEKPRQVLAAVVGEIMGGAAVEGSEGFAAAAAAAAAVAVVVVVEAVPVAVVVAAAAAVTLVVVVVVAVVVAAAWRLHAANAKI